MAARRSRRSSNVADSTRTSTRSSTTPTTDGYWSSGGLLDRFESSVTLPPYAEQVRGEYPQVAEADRAAPPSQTRAWSFLVGGDLVYRALAAGFWLVLARALDAPSLGDVALATAISVPALIVLDGGLAQ